MKNSYICTEVMNKTDIKYYSIAVALATASLAGVSCDREEDDIWSQSSAERLEQAQTEDRKILYSAPNGWQMLYFCNGQEQGYNFLMKFDEHGGVMIATRNPNTRNAYTEEASMYDVLADDGPVLSFSTYNSLFHRYADPDPEHTQGSDGVGSAGDYEFNIMTIADTMIYLRGKKSKVDIYMYPLEEGKDWEEYFDDLYALRDSMFNPSIPTMWLTLADGSRYSITGASTQIMNFVPEGGDAITQTTIVPYVLTETGLRLMSPFPNDSVDGDNVQVFNFNEAGTFLVGDDETAGGAVATIKSAPFAELFADQDITWSIDADDLGGQFADAYAAVAEGYDDYTPFTLQGVRFGYNTRVGFHTFSLYSTRMAGAMYCEEIVDGETGISFTFSGEGDTNGVRLYDNIPAYGEFMQLLASKKFTLTSDSEINPSRIKFTCQDNENDYFYVELL